MSPMPRYFSGVAGGLARMREVAPASRAAESGDLGAEQEASTTTAAAIRPRSDCLIRPLAPHRPLAFQHSFERGTRFFRQVIGLFVRGILPRGNIGTKGLHRTGDGGAQVSVSAYKLGGMAKGEIQQVVEDQYLSVAIRARADSDRRRPDLSRNH